MKVFISHAYTDEPFVRKITTGLEEAGLDVWDATREILSEDTLTKSIAQALKESEAMVVLLTADALRSSWVRREIEYALGERNYRKRLVPVLVGNPEELPKENIPWILRHLPMIDMSEYDEEEKGIKQIVQAILENDITSPPPSASIP